MIRERLNTNDAGACGTGTSSGENCKDGSNWNSFCNTCHYYYSPFHAGMSCGTASCHVANSIHRMSSTGKGGGPIKYDGTLVLDYRFNKNLKDSGSWHMHGKWKDKKAGAFAAGRSGYAVALDGKHTIQVGTQDDTWSTCEGGRCGTAKGQGGGSWKYTHMKYNTTLEAWVYPTDKVGTIYSIFTKHTGTGNGDYALELRRMKGALRVALVCQIDNNAGALGGIAGRRGAYSSAGIPLNAWTHVAASFDTKGPDRSASDATVGRIRIYVNGNDVTTSNASGSYQQPGKGETSIFAFPENNSYKPSVCYNGTWCAGEFSIGGFHEWQKPFIGRLDDARVWNVTKPASHFSPLAAKQPPRLAVAVASGAKLTVVFDEPVYSSSGGVGALAPGDLTYVDNDSSGAQTITAVSHQAGSTTATLTLSAAVAASDLGVDGVAALSGQVFDKSGNTATTTALIISAAP